MIARIKTETGNYDSVVFAFIKRGWWSKVVVFNREGTALEVVEMWTLPKRNVFIYNYEREADWIVKRKVEGYDWILKNMSDRFNKIDITETAILDKCKALQAKVDPREWFEINDQDDITGLMACACGFHDAYIIKIYAESDKRYINFDTTWGCHILLELDGNIETNLFKGFGNCLTEDGKNYLAILYASMFFENGLIYWIDDESVKSGINLKESGHYYFCANRVKWKPIID